MKCSLIIVLIVFILATLASAQSFNEELFKQFADMRIGTGEPV